MFTIYRDMRVVRGRQMAGGLVDVKLENCHLNTTVTPTQVNFIKNQIFEKKEFY